MRYPEIAADTAAATTERLDRARRLQLGWLDRVIRSLPLTHLSASRLPAPLPRPRVLALPDVNFCALPANSFNRCPRSTASLLTGWFLLFHVGVKDRMPFALLHLPDRRGVVGP